MNEHWISYRDVMGFPRKQIEVLRAPKAGEQRVKDQVIPALYDFPATYIRWRHVEVGEVLVHLCTYTEKELSIKDVERIAWQFVEGLKHEGSEP